MKRKTIIILSSLLLIFGSSIAQQSSEGVSVGDTLFDPHPSALFELRSDAKGFLPPRLSTTDREAIYQPADGLMVYDTTEQQYYYFDNQWKVFGSNVYWLADTSGNLYYTNGKVGIGIDTPSYNLQLIGMMKAQMGDYSISLDTSIHDGLPFGGAYQYKFIDTSNFVVGGIIDFSAFGGDEDNYYISVANIDESDEQLHAFSMTADNMYMLSDSENDDVASGVYLTKQNVTVTSSDFAYVAGSTMMVSKDLLRLQNTNDTTYAAIDLDSVSASISYMSDQDNSNKIELNEQEIINRLNGADLSAETSFSLANGWVCKGKDESSQSFTVTDSADVELFYLQNDGLAYFDGDVGIGQSSPSEKLHVNGNILASGSITEYSDRTLKKDILTLQDALEKVLGLRGVSYNWKDKEKDQTTQIGLIAQEVEEIYPELVKTDKEGKKHLHYTGLIAPLIEAIKELSEENDILRSQMETLTKDQQGLKAEIEWVKEQVLMQGNK